MSDQELLVLAKAFLARRSTSATVAERHAWEEFFVTYDPIIRASIRRIHTAQDIVDDCAQDVWVLLIRKLPRWKYDPVWAPIGAWVTKIALRLATKRARRRARPGAESLGEAHAGTLVDPEPGPDIEFEKMQEHELFGALVLEFSASLPERVRGIVVMRFLESRAAAEIARILEVSYDCVQSILHRVIPKLQSFLRQRGLRPS